MKKEVSSTVAIVLIVIVVVIIGGFFYFRSRPQAAGGANQPPPLPPSVGQTMSEIMSKAGQQPGQSAPGQHTGQQPQLGPGSVPTPPTPPR